MLGEGRLQIANIAVKDITRPDLFHTRTKF
jgi:hypothetical protein